MPNYLPVLLVSVTNTNIIPDDSSVSTLPRGQVDYLSHNWQEEDVWRSWREMTRQKNEIANGVRLENASWRTWWKQRNKLKTVTPETLNWLKDSDVTWLYGPLHTATDWGPPAKGKPEGPDPVLNRTDQPRHKPILKHRSISQFLTSDLPLPSLFSPADSESESSQSQNDTQGVSLPPKSPKPQRPALLQTKSDTHITCWNPNHGFRTESPQRIEPPIAMIDDIATSQNETNTDGYVPQSQIRHSYSQDSSSTGASTAGHADRRSNGTGQKKKHISFNTFVEQYIAIEKPNSVEEGPKISGPRRCDDDDGYEEDEEDNAEDDDDPWDGRTRHHPPGGSAIAGSDSDEDKPSEEEEEDDDDDDGVIEMRSRSFGHPSTPKKRAARSPSTSASTSTSSSSRSTSTSSASRSMSPPSPNQGEHLSSMQPSTRAHTRRSSIASTYRPRSRLYSTSYYASFRSGSEYESQYPRTRNPPQVHVTIAPIAPTILKTTESGYDGWTEGFGDEGGSDDGIWGTRWGEFNEQGDVWKERDRRRADDDGSTPVELVYVPSPFIGRYPIGVEIGTEDEDFDVEEERIEERQEMDGTGSSPMTPRAVGDWAYASSKEPSDSSAASTITPPSPNPAVTIGSLSKPSSPEIRVQEPASKQAQEALHAGFSEQDFHENLCRRLSSPEEGSSASLSSRSRSRSRTPSPLVDPPSPEISNLPARTSSSASLPPLSPSSLLAPPIQRGRCWSSYQDLSSRGQQTRGRSSTRTPPPQSDCERNGSLESPIGSLSPDSSFIRVASAVGGVYASGRIDKGRQKERERREEREQRGRDRDRGRDRTGKRLNQSLSPDFESGIVMRETSSYEGRPSRVVSNARPAPTWEKTCGEATPKASAPERSLEDAKPSHTPCSEQGLRKEGPDEVKRTIQPTPCNSPLIIAKAPLAGLAAPKLDTTFQTTSHSTTHRSPPTSPSQRHHSHTPVAINTHVSPTRISSPTSPRVRSPSKGKSPLCMPPPPQLAEPSTSLSISPPGPRDSSPVASSSRQPQSPTSPTGKEPSTIVEKAVGMMSTYFGLWHS